MLPLERFAWVWLVLIALVGMQSPLALSRPVGPATAIPHPWLKESSAPPAARVQFFLALKQRNLAELTRLFWAVSDPESDEYQRFLTPAAIQELVSPAASERQVVVDWLVGQGVQVELVLDYGDSLEVTTTVEVAERLFDSSFHVMMHANSGQRIIRALGGLSVPLPILERVELVAGLTGFPVPHLDAHLKASYPPNNDAVLPQTLNSLYGIPLGTPVGQDSGISQGVIEWDGQSFSPSDLVLYGTDVSLNGKPVVSHIIGPNDPKEADGVSTIDVDMITGVAPGNSLWFWLEANAWLYGFAVHFMNASSVPDVISISYSEYEGDQCSGKSGECAALGINSTQYVQRMDVEFQKFGLRGVTVVVASGDSGTHTQEDHLCSSPVLMADYPATSPFVLSVGGTEIVNATFFNASITPACLPSQRDYQCIQSGVERAVERDRAYFSSGGGFSNISAMPAYQKAAVSAYLSNPNVTLPPASMYNASNRARPDVAAVGHHGFFLVLGGQNLGGGTGVSTPIFAGVVALLNVEFKKLTGYPLGFVNPLLYKMWADRPETFHDITIGDNRCSEVACFDYCEGFYASKGWDPVTTLSSATTSKRSE